MPEVEPQRVHSTSQTSFTANAALYDKARPSYVPGSINALIEMLKLQEGSKVLDLACGTGIFTRLIHNRGFDITAAEPSPGMRKAFSARTPEIPIVASGAHDLPFPDGTFDAVTIAQAFHWFADEDALKEIARVLKPQGRVAMIWNLEKTGVTAWMDEHFHAMVAYDGNVPQYRKNDWMPVLNNTKVFRTPYEEYLEDYSLTYTEDELWDRCQSKSFITCLSDDEQMQLKQRLSDIISRHPEAERASDGKLICPQFVRVVAMQKV